MIFRIVLGIYAVMAFVVLGVIHMFFATAYFKAIHYPLWNAADPVQREMVELIGASYIAQGLGGFLVWREPVRNRDLFVVLMAAGVMSVVVVAYTIMIGVAPPVVWANTVIPYSILMTIMVICYPWAAASGFQSAHRR